MKKRTYEIWKRHTDGPDELWDWDDNCNCDTKTKALRLLTDVYGEGFYLVEVVRTRVPKSEFNPSPHRRRPRC